jgi:Cation transporter/ATPase, N-terminus
MPLDHVVAAQVKLAVFGSTCASQRHDQSINQIVERRLSSECKYLFTLRKPCKNSSSRLFVFIDPRVVSSPLPVFINFDHNFFRPPTMNGLPKTGTPPLLHSPNTPSLQYSFLTPDETASRLRTNLTSGLADHQDYLHRRSIHGLNQLKDDEPDPLYIKFLNQFKESPMILLLLASAGVSVLMGNVDDAISITLVYNPA